MNNFALNCIIATSLLVNTFPPSSTVTPKPSFTQLSCKVLDKNYLAVEECSMNSENVVNIRVKLHKRPIDNITLQGMVMKYVDDSYQIYYFNNVYDICKIMRSKRNFFVEYVYQQALPYTNFNHTCPFTESYIYVKKFRFDNSKLRPLKMLMEGKYALIGTWMSNQITRFYWRKKEHVSPENIFNRDKSSFYITYANINN